MAHTCNREDCKRENVNGPKANCYACKKLCFLGCYGVLFNHLTAYKQTENESDQFFTPTSNIQFICTACLQPSKTPSSQVSLNESMNLGTPKTEKITIKAIATEIVKLQEQFASFQSSSNDMNNKLDSIEIKTTDIKANTEAVLNKTSAQPNNTNGKSPVVFGSPLISGRPFRPQLNRSVKTWASVAANNGNASQNSTPNGTKRRRVNETPVQQMKKSKPNVPVPKTGTNANASGLVVVAKPAPKKPAEKPKFEKAVWVSRLGPTVTEECIKNHIASISSISSNFTVHKLVKKDRDVSTLNFVSFKIAVNIPDFEILNDPSVWPENVLVREFVEIKPATFGDFLPTNLNAKSSRKSPGKPESMDIQPETSKTTPTKPASAS